MVTFRVELANYTRADRAVGSLYGVARYVDDCRQTWVLVPQADRELAYNTALKLNSQTSCGIGGK